MSNHSNTQRLSRAAETYRPLNPHYYPVSTARYGQLNTWERVTIHKSYVPPKEKPTRRITNHEDAVVPSVVIGDRKAPPARLPPQFKEVDGYTIRIKAEDAFSDPNQMALDEEFIQEKQNRYRFEVYTPNDLSDE